jgi:dCMP deaminase
MNIVSHSVNKLSLEAKTLLDTYSLPENLNREHIENRDNWHIYFLKLARGVAKRSTDAQTQHGSVIVNDSHEIIGTGYNGILRGIDNFKLPNLRPLKYLWYGHSECQAILSCARQGKSTLNSTIYVTGEPCINCYQLIWQAGIKRVIFGDRNSNMIDKEMQTQIEVFKFLTQLEILEIVEEKRDIFEYKQMSKGL